MSNSFDAQAKKFTDLTDTTIHNVWIDHDYHFQDDTQTRDIYYVKLTSKGRGCMKSYSFKFGQSVRDSSTNPQRRVRPTDYDIFCCLSATDPGTFEDWCSGCGYDTDSIKAFELYRGVCKEFEGLNRLYNDAELAMLSEIC